MIQKDLKGTCILIGFAVFIAFLFNHYSPNGIALIGQWETSKGHVKAKSKSDPVSSSMEIVDVDRIKNIIDTNERKLIDVRSRSAYDAGHLPKAVSFPLSDFDKNISNLLSTIKRDEPLLVYCESIDCPASHTFAKQLIFLKYTDIKIFSGGFLAWEEKGYQIIKNE